MDKPIARENGWWGNFKYKLAIILPLIWISLMLLFVILANFIPKNLGGTWWNGSGLVGLSGISGYMAGLVMLMFLAGFIFVPFLFILGISLSNSIIKSKTSNKRLSECLNYWIVLPFASIFTITVLTVIEYTNGGLSDWTPAMQKFSNTTSFLFACSPVILLASIITGVFVNRYKRTG